MPTFYCKRACFFRDRFWEAGERVDAAKAEELNEHFTPVAPPPLEKSGDEPIALSEIGKSRGPDDFVSVIRSRPNPNPPTDAEAEKAVSKSSKESAKGKAE